MSEQTHISGLLLQNDICILGQIEYDGTEANLFWLVAKCARQFLTHLDILNGALMEGVGLTGRYALTVEPFAIVYDEWRALIGDTKDHSEISHMRTS